ncbi:hypothetical protein WSI_05160 [Candidatus Liberibacter asiaticus str. gxpsy]|uniref:Uncharacterized protein n=2 Tax=Liberibacter asiaticus TaxID=34021 RepID=C6XGX5_LIBAP|nr:hypothetical protein CLIBASIA_05310 [Candidatus Liberibacter asiaticus str. psy62]AGH17389.1 hypothetical protein WSI_05160 [Candidatus Liberibacter asiaticus str. gxpsy]BAP26923.1 hypothetical protein CGUJ_05310 [Candidatus Liberibacter asiaticus str. Ishi-1]
MGFKKPYQNQIEHAQGGRKTTAWLVHIFKKNLMER